MSDDLRRLTAEAVAALRTALAAGHGVRDALREGFARNTAFFNSVFTGVLFHALGDDPSASEIGAFALRLEAGWLSEPQAFEPHEVEAVLRAFIGDISMMGSVRRDVLSSPEIPVAVMDSIFAAWRPTPAELDELFRISAEAERGIRLLSPPDLWADPGDPARERERQLAGTHLDKEDAEPLIARARAAASAGYRETAKADYDSAIILDPDNVTALTERGVLRNRLGQRAEALADLNRAIELDPGDAEAIAARGETYRCLERYGEAQADFSRAIELDPGYGWAIAKRGDAYRMLERYDEALADLNRAIELDSSDALAIGSRGSAGDGAPLV